MPMGPLAPDRDHLAGRRIDHDRAHGRLAAVGGGLRGFERDAHGAMIMVHDPAPNRSATRRSSPHADE